MEITKFATIYVDMGESCDYKGRILDICNTKEEAINRIRTDMEEYMDEKADLGFTADFVKMQAYDENYINGCEWSYQEITIKV